MKLTLTGKIRSLRTRKIMWVADECNLNLEVKEINTIADTKTNDFLQKNGMGQIPILETSDGVICESGAIMRHLVRLSKSNLMGNDELQKAQINCIIDQIGLELEPACTPIIYGTYGYIKQDQTTFKQAGTDIKNQCKIFNNLLNNQQYLCGNQLSVADIYLATIMDILYRIYFDDKTSKQYPFLMKWFLSLTKLPSYIKNYGKPVFCQKPFEIVFKQEEKKQEKKKQESKKAAPKAEQKEVKPEVLDIFKKKENPLDVLPASTFNLFDFKTEIVNSTDLKQTMEQFWKIYDPAGYSLWLVKYEKYEGEGEKLFLTNNLVGGYFQRLDHFRKYSFGVHGVYGDEPNFDIKGVWVWRGTEIPFEVSDHVSYEYHTFQKLDHTKVEHKQLVEDFWTKNQEDQDVVEGQMLRSFRQFK